MCAIEENGLENNFGTVQISVGQILVCCARIWNKDILRLEYFPDDSQHCHLLLSCTSDQQVIAYWSSAKWMETINHDWLSLADINWMRQKRDFNYK